VRNLESVNQDVPKDLLDLSMQAAWFRNTRYKGGSGKKLGALGMRERPGLGSGGDGGGGGGG
jgi:ATP-dependent RNA helicase DDX42